MRRSDRYRKKRWKRSLFIFLIVIFLSLLAGVAYYATSIYQFLDEVTMSDGASPSMNEEKLLIEEKKPFSILLLGMDMNFNLSSRTDTIMVATINPDSNDMKLVSIPRDTLVETNFGFTEKINAMYTYGGIDLMITEVEKILDIPISHYAILDFKGLAELVDVVGGIQVYSDLEFKESNSLNSKEPIEIKEGLQTLNGEEALGYSRMRKQDPRGDFGRQERQQQVVEALLDELLSLNLLTNFNPILEATSPYLKTNLTGNQMLSLAMNYRDAVNDIDTYQIAGEDRIEYFPHYGLNVYTFIPFEESLGEVSEDLQDHLNIYSRHSTTDHLQTSDELKK